MKSLPAFSTLSRKGISFVEVISCVALIGIIAALAMPVANRLTMTSTEANLQADVNTLNRTIGVYLASGGDLTGVNDCQVVLDKLKTSSSDADRYAGFDGSSIDSRLKCEFLPSSKESTRQLRCFFDETKQRFVTQRSGSDGVESFVVDDALAAVDYGTEARVSSGLTYSGDSTGWVWDYSDTAPASGPIATSISNTSAPGITGPSAPTPTTTPPVVPNPVAPTVGQLSPPNCDVNTLPCPVTESNTPDCRILCSIDGGPFQECDGTLDVRGGETIKGFCQSLDPDYEDSPVASWEVPLPCLLPPVCTPDGNNLVCENPNEGIDCTIICQIDNGPEVEGTCFPVGTGTTCIVICKSNDPCYADSEPIVCDLTDLFPFICPVNDFRLTNL